MLTIRVLCRKGDEPQTFDMTDTDQRSLAEQLFNAKVAAGAMAWSVADGKREQLHTFDPAAVEIVIAYPMAGG